MVVLVRGIVFRAVDGFKYTRCYASQQPLPGALTRVYDACLRHDEISNPIAIGCAKQDKFSLIAFRKPE